MVLKIDPTLVQLKEKGGRVTQQRGAVINAMRDLSVPSTVEDIFQAAIRRRAVDLVTTYRILEQLEKRGLVARNFGKTGTQLFTLRTDRPRYFAFERATNKAFEIDAEIAAATERSTRKIEESLAKRGYTELTSVVQFFLDLGSAVVPKVKPLPAPTPVPLARPKYASLRSIVDALKADFPESDPKSVVHHPAFEALEKLARRNQKRG